MARLQALRFPQPASVVVVILLGLMGCTTNDATPPSPPAATPANQNKQGNTMQKVPGRMQRVVSTQPWKHFDADFLYTCALQDPGSLWCWGMNYSGKLGDGTTVSRALPVQVGTDSDWTAFSMADHVTCGIKADASLWCWGTQDGSRPLRGGEGKPTLAPKRVPVAPAGPFCTVDPTAQGLPVVDVGLGDAHTCVLTTQGTILCTGDADKAGAKKLLHCHGWQPIETGGISPEPTFKALSVGSKHSCAVTTQDAAFCWGQNHRGQVGSGKKNPVEATPTALDLSRLPPGTSVRQLAAGTFHTCMILSDNTLACWGGNDGGCLASNDTLDRFSPTPVVLPEYLQSVDWKEIDGGFHTTCALSRGGDIYCWGSLYCPQGTVHADSVACGPEPISGPSIDGMPPYQQLAVGCSHACALDGAGNLYCWGSNTEGELGIGAPTPPPAQNAASPAATGAP